MSNLQSIGYLDENKVFHGIYLHWGLDFDQLTENHRESLVSMIDAAGSVEAWIEQDIHDSGYSSFRELIDGDPYSSNVAMKIHMDSNGTFLPNSTHVTGIWDIAKISDEDYVEFNKALDSGEDENEIYGEFGLHQLVGQYNFTFHDLSNRSSDSTLRSL